MDEITSATRELADILRNSRTNESSLTIKWAVVLTVVVAVCGFLFIGYMTNANRITKLETQYTYAIESITQVKSSQARVEELLAEIRYDQKRREAKETR